MEDQPNQADKATAKKDVLQTDIGYRIVDAINLAGIIQDALGFAESQIEQIGISDQELQELYLNSLESQNEAVRNAWADLAKEESEKGNGAEAIITRQVDTQAYRMFLNRFYTLWIETKNNIANEFWEESKKEEITTFFEETSKGAHDPRKTLELFHSLLQSLYNCGIMNFQYKTVNEEAAYDNEYFKILIDASKKKGGGKSGRSAKKQ